MKKLPLVSVLIVTHNRKEFLKRCLESVKKQTYKNIETIVVDDGSTDDFTDLLGLLNDLSGIGTICHIQRTADYGG